MPDARLCYSRFRPSPGPGVRRLRLGIKVGLTLMLVLRALTAQAQTQLKPLRFDFSVLGGYRTNVNFTGPAETVEPAPTTPTPRIVIDASPSYGFAFGARINELDLIEVRW